MAKVTKGAKGSKGPVVTPAAPAASVKVKVTLDREVYRVLRLEAFGRDCSLGALVEELVRSSPRRFVLVDRGSVGAKGPVDGGGSSAPTVQLARGGVADPGSVDLSTEVA